jgi:hypothetical protein
MRPGFGRFRLLGSGRAAPCTSFILLLSRPRSIDQATLDERVRRAPATGAPGTAHPGRASPTVHPLPSGARAGAAPVRQGQITRHRSRLRATRFSAAAMEEHEPEPRATSHMPSRLVFHGGIRIGDPVLLGEILPGPPVLLDVFEQAEPASSWRRRRLRSCRAGACIFSGTAMIGSSRISVVRRLRRAMHGQLEVRVVTPGLGQAQRRSGNRA